MDKIQEEWDKIQHRNGTNIFKEHRYVMANLYSAFWQRTPLG